MLTAKFSRTYRNKKGTTVFVFDVNGTVSEIKDYSDTVGENLRIGTESQKPLFFTPFYTGDNIKLLKTSNNRFITDTSEQDKLNALSGGLDNVQKAMASLAAAKIMSGMRSSAGPVSAGPATAGVHIDEDGIVVDELTEGGEPQA